MEYTTSIDVGVKQQWRRWPSPLGKTGVAKWLLPEEKDLIKVVEFSNRNHSSPLNPPRMDYSRFTWNLKFRRLGHLTFDHLTLLCPFNINRMHHV